VATGETRTLRLERPVPVLLIYWTVDEDNQGRIVFKRDPYGRDRRSPPRWTSGSRSHPPGDLRRRRPARGTLTRWRGSG